MSSFPGRLRESDEISIDQFSGTNLSSSVFFLSHCHHDHMVGLGSAAFLNALRSEDRPLFCHPITKQLLLHDPRRRYNQLEPFIVTREVEAPFTIFSDGAPLAKVTFLGAKHCPGSVMILFEFDLGQNVLYTGDFRLARKDWLAFSSLRLSPLSARFKPIDSLYFDSTFCSEESRQIQSREQCKHLLLRVVKEWLSRRPKNKVLIWSYANYGHEFILKSLWKALRMKIHVAAERLRTYKSCGSKFADFATADAEETRLHGCVYWAHEEEEDKVTRRQVLGCSGCSAGDEAVMVVKLSMMWFSLQKGVSSLNMVGYVQERFTRLQYSCHSSLTEVEEAFRILRPKRAYPNVVGRGINGQKIANHFRPFLNRSTTIRAPVLRGLGAKPLRNHPVQKNPSGFSEYLRVAENVAGRECKKLDLLMCKLRQNSIERMKE
ncbi:hypothetical protein QR680_017623 [Steinernema hermaphroditum]|uniref:DNA repair metallo-beta-lactamase domain-containing protein n=1 Tax=Steinernema hermaphroditum TaxID=289476 RepID=A0AA39HF97_9BILA|nr:hypothetical protein QR680_017623 [Steinernema hermaphroditum]